MRKIICIALAATVLILLATACGPTGYCAWCGRDNVKLQNVAGYSIPVCAACASDLSGQQKEAYDRVKDMVNNYTQPPSGNEPAVPDAGNAETPGIAPPVFRVMMGFEAETGGSLLYFGDRDIISIMSGTFMIQYADYDSGTMLTAYSEILSNGKVRLTDVSTEKTYDFVMTIERDVLTVTDETGASKVFRERDY